MSSHICVGKKYVTSGTQTSTYWRGGPQLYKSHADTNATATEVKIVGQLVFMLPNH